MRDYTFSRAIVNVHCLGRFLEYEYQLLYMQKVVMKDPNNELSEKRPT